MQPNKFTANCQILTFGSPPIPRAMSSFNEPVDITGARLAPKKRFKDSIDSFPKSLARRVRAICKAASLLVALVSLGSSSNTKSVASAKNKTKNNIISVPLTSVKHYTNLLHQEWIIF